MDTERLTKLADLLDTVPRERFDLSRWTNGMPPAHCGFAACAIGWAAASGQFEGLTLERDEDSSYPAYESTSGWDAVQAYFGLPYLKAYWLFDLAAYFPSQLRDPAAVAARIRTLVTQGEAA